MVWNITAQFMSAVQDFAHSKPTGVGGNVGKTAWMLWEHCSTIAKTLLCFQGLPATATNHRL